MAIPRDWVESVVVVVWYYLKVLSEGQVLFNTLMHLEPDHDRDELDRQWEDNSIIGVNFRVCQYDKGHVRPRFRTRPQQGWATNMDAMAWTWENRRLIRNANIYSSANSLDGVAIFHTTIYMYTICNSTKNKDYLNQTKKYCNMIYEVIMLIFVFKPDTFPNSVCGWIRQSNLNHVKKSYWQNKNY